jgi:UPF0716 protein FxsA
MALLLVLIFIVLPIAEIYVIIKVGEAIGVLPTIALLIVDGFVGAALARSQGRQAWARFNQALAAGRVPAREVFDGAMIIVGGAFLLAPGFITDVIGLALVLPFTRAIFRGLTARFAKRRVVIATPGAIFSSTSSARRRDRARDYDVEGTAREVDDTEHELPPGDRDG